MYILSSLLLLASLVQAKVQYAGINIAGCDFGCGIDGTCNTGGVCPPPDAAGQMQHFVQKSGFNIFRLPFGWQYAVNHVPGGPLDENFMANIDGIVEQCLGTGAACILDVHNYGRWDGQVVGQSGIGNDALVSLWTQLATRYRCDSDVIFGIMNEPHDLDMSAWATTVSAVVSAIRSAGATDQMILIPGTDFTSAGPFAQNSAPFLSGIRDADGSTDKLVYDVHQYLDQQGGTTPECVMDGVDGMRPLTDYLRANGRKALMTETGGGNTASCMQMVCQQFDYMNQNADVYMGWVGWAAGAFGDSYELAMMPDGDTDKPIVSQCVAGMFK